MVENQKALKVFLSTPVWKLLNEFKQNKHLIENASSVREGYDDKTPGKIMGLTVAAFVIIVIISIALYIWAIVLLIQHGNTMPAWSVIVSVIFLFLGFPIIPIILVFVTKGTKRRMVESRFF